MQEDCGGASAAAVELMIASGARAVGLNGSFARCAGWGEVVRKLARRKRKILLTPISCFI
jgi:hypothetical protein